MSQDKYDELYEKIWNDANFKPTKTINQSNDMIKKNNIRQLNNDNFYIAQCKICNIELKLSCNYSGKFPLCKVHRDPNDRAAKLYNNNNNNNNNN